MDTCYCMVFEGKLIYMGGAPEWLEFWADPYEIFFGAIFARVGRQLVLPSTPIWRRFGPAAKAHAID